MTWLTVLRHKYENNKKKATLNLQYEKDFLGRNLSDDMVCRAYIRGATEQREIDIKKACEWLRSRNVLTEASIEGFRKVLEE